MKPKTPTKEQIRLSNEICMAAIDRCKILINEAAEANQHGARSLMDISIMAALLAEVMGKQPINTHGMRLMEVVVAISVDAYMDWGKLDEVSLTACIAKELMGQSFLEGGGWLGDVVKKARERVASDGQREAATGSTERRPRVHRGAVRSHRHEG